jgi:hypothetical protein
VTYPDFPTRNPLVLDIETVPLAASLAMPYPEATRSAPANYKTDEAIAKWREADRIKWYEDRAKECSLNPRLGRIVVIGTNVETIVAPAEADEREALVRFWEYVKAFAGFVVTWNGSWDLRFLVIRSLAHGVTPSVPPSVVQSWFKKYSTHQHYDCKAVLMNWDTAKAGDGLNEWAAFFGIGEKMNGMTGADVWRLYQEGNASTIAKYCQQDVALTAAIYARIRHVLA